MRHLIPTINDLKDRPTAKFLQWSTETPESGVLNNCFDTYTDDDGTKYVGEWKDDKSHGQGTETYAGGNQYVGEWKDGKYHGKGTLTDANGRDWLFIPYNQLFNGCG